MFPIFPSCEPAHHIWPFLLPSAPCCHIWQVALEYPEGGLPEGALVEKGADTSLKTKDGWTAHRCAIGPPYNGTGSEILEG